MPDDISPETQPSASELAALLDHQSLSQSGTAKAFQEASDALVESIIAENHPSNPAASKTNDAAELFKAGAKELAKQPIKMLSQSFEPEIDPDPQSISQQRARTKNKIEQLKEQGIQGQFMSKSDDDMEILRALALGLWQGYKYQSKISKENDKLNGLDLINHPTSKLNNPELTSNKNHKLQIIQASKKYPELYALLNPTNIRDLPYSFKAIRIEHEITSLDQAVDTNKFETHSLGQSSAYSTDPFSKQAPAVEIITKDHQKAQPEPEFPGYDVSTNTPSFMLDLTEPREPIKTRDLHLSALTMRSDNILTTVQNPLSIQYHTDTAQSSTPSRISNLNIDTAIKLDLERALEISEFDTNDNTGHQITKEPTIEFQNPIVDKIGTALAETTHEATHELSQLVAPSVSSHDINPSASYDEFETINPVPEASKEAFPPTNLGYMRQPAIDVNFVRKQNEPVQQSIDDKFAQDLAIAQQQDIGHEI